MTKIEQLLKAKDELIAKANDISKQIEELKEKPSQGRFVPELGEEYWTIEQHGIDWFKCDNDYLDQWNILTGNCYRTKEEAEAVREAIVELDKLTFIPDWEDKKQDKWFNSYSNTDKIKELRHIQQMIVDQRWVDDQAVEDEINARVSLFACIPSVINGCVRQMDKWVIARLRCRDFPEYLSSLDAIVSIQEEGWLITIKQAHEKLWCCELRHKTHRIKTLNRPYTVGIRNMPTETAARLYAVLETIIYRLENEND